MKFKKSTQILFAVALVLATGVAVYEGTIAPERQAAELQERQVFDFEVDRVTSLTVETPDRTLQFDRLPPEEDSTEFRWQFQVLEASDQSEIQKTPIPAKEAYVSFLSDALVNANSDRILSVAASELGEYGLDEPQAEIEVKLDDETIHQIQLGKRDFSESLVYAIADLPAEETTARSVLLVSTNLENSVNRSLSEWQSDREETPAPVVSPTPFKTSEPADTDANEIEVIPESEASPTPTNSEEIEATETIEEPLESTQTPEIETTEPTPQPEELENSESPSKPSTTSDSESDLE
ncbi:DUF4340 domain-containing protein [Oscillatoriales cyanobacterium LEGE 11467]|uniref:DUF4340 domain-containing protein n=1 Tax=Zarconia navalis LEGE 11467 TaxID=1828826 RepID=A0A928VY04_9CYAN|nr:DUF4340 domain-containing protein [Zarconia navalis]MBE9040336.1 DUF4340 domain-containing protein [Zarconia navalis LEGE 11467]